MSDTKHYLKRVVPQHRRPKFMKWLEANLITVDDAVNVINEIDNAFDIDNAVGVQLDVIGEIVGRERMLNFEPPLGLSPVLEDPIYSTLLKAKISLNNWDGMLSTACSMLKEWFPQYSFILYDNQDMTISFYLFGDPPILEREFIARGYIAPKSEGVRIRYEFILPEIETERTMYTGGAVVGDYQEVVIPARDLRNMKFGVKQSYATGLWDVSYMEIPTAELREELEVVKS